MNYIMKVIILTTDENSDYAKESYKTWIDNGFKVEYYKVKRETNVKPSKIIMNNWKKYFAINEIKEDIIIAEDDVYVLKKYDEMINEIAHDKINYLCFQKQINGGSIKVGSQAIYIPLVQLQYFKSVLNKMASRHFDRFMSRVYGVVFPYKAKEFGEEIEHISQITNKIRLGKKSI